MHNTLQLDNANSQDEINTIIDDPRYAAILNASGWPITKCITPVTKSEFLQNLLFSEVILKRQRAVQAFCKGLDHLNVHKLVKENMEVMRPVFLFDSQQVLTPDTFIRSISTPKPRDRRLREVYSWFFEYVESSESRKASPEEVLSFTTGLRRMPPMGLKECIKIDFLQRSPLPKAEACFSIIKLPTIHEDKMIFFEKLDQGIQNSIGHFGQI